MVKGTAPANHEGIDLLCETQQIEQDEAAKGYLLLPGDELLTECVMNSMSRSADTISGHATTDEMCLIFLNYYPVAEIGRAHV